MDIETIKKLNYNAVDTYFDIINFGQMFPAGITSSSESGKSIETSGDLLATFSLRPGVGDPDGGRRLVGVGLVVVGHPQIKKMDLYYKK